MDIIYKEPYQEPHRYEKIADMLNRQFPERIFRAIKYKKNFVFVYVGVEEYVGSWISFLWGGTWKELDLKAMGLE